MNRLDPVFQCQLCRKPVPRGIPAQRVVVQARVKKYPFRFRANRLVRITEKGKRKVTFIDDPGGVGTEIEREIMVCPDCAARTMMPPQ